MWTQYWPIYEQLENELREITFFISLEDVHLNVFSARFAELLLRIGQECENIGKTLATQLALSPSSGTIQRLNFPSLGNLLCTNVALNAKVVEVIWVYQSLSTSKKLLTPFSTWSSSGSVNPVWYDTYNGFKHDRNTHFSRANYGNVIEALAGLFILNLWLRKDDIERDSEWIVLARKRITSYSELFDPSSFLQLGLGGTNKRLELV